MGSKTFNGAVRLESHTPHDQPERMRMVSGAALKDDPDSLMKLF